MAPPTLRWGVVGTGWIADMLYEQHRKSQKFIDNHWGGAGPAPRALHKWNCLDAIRTGKHVLCEKPMALDSEEVESIVAAARAKAGEKGELWRHRPRMALRHRNWPRPRLGQPASNPPPEDPALGGGALLDLGIYTLTYSSVIMGRGLYGDAHPSPEMISSMDIVNGVDETTTVILQYKTTDGEPQTAVALATTLADSQRDFGRIQGKKGVITLYTEFGPSCPSGFRIRWADGSEQDFPFKHPEGTIGFIHEADAVAKDIFAGRTENERMPLAETLRMMRLMDRVRAQNGLVYPKNNR
ncbi:unnamed protein product [Parascedosporium putredinis]|uniref:D-xylose 1-dehydrogenase (NADP(+), D-xylono-1,5-lactone-forming) n=1 Tax=Parascedosporium putredinis TaxID=1442378 RepID=A0A9P1GZZ6_9PEZI|nr:unnamed protein product [Parascedosporium putredinis]CAI7992314.1 unnamed protein product [Parascedosporium putredinis]